MLDGDIKEQFKNKYTKNGVYKDINVQFLPLQSVEKYMLNKLSIQPDKVFAKRFGDKFFRIRSLTDILSDYRQNFKNDNDGKKLYGLLRSCARDQRTSDNEFLSLLCEFIYDYEDFNKMSNSLNRVLNG